jgi:hypothetical protein
MKNLSIYAQKEFCGFQITGSGKQDLLWFWIAVVEEAFVVMCPCQGCEFHLHMCHNTQYQSPIPDAQTRTFDRHEVPLVLKFYQNSIHSSPGIESQDKKIRTQVWFINQKPTK